mgnify:CR=1 FL=1
MQHMTFIQDIAKQNKIERNLLAEVSLLFKLTRIFPI